MVTACDALRTAVVHAKQAVLQIVLSSALLFPPWVKMAAVLARRECRWSYLYAFQEQASW